VRPPKTPSANGAVSRRLISPPRDLWIPSRATLPPPPLLPHAPPCRPRMERGATAATSDFSQSITRKTRGHPRARRFPSYFGRPASRPSSLSLSLFARGRSLAAITRIAQTGGIYYGERGDPSRSFLHAIKLSLHHRLAFEIRGGAKVDYIKYRVGESDVG